MELNELLRLFCAAKAQEQKAVDDRRAIEDTIVQVLREQGHTSGTHKTDRFKVVVRTGETFKLDEKKWKQVEGQVPEEAQPIKWKAEADPKGCRYLRENEPALWAVIAAAIEARESRPSIAVEEVGQ